MNKMNKAIGMATLWLASAVSAPASLWIGDDFSFGSGVPDRNFSAGTSVNGVLLQYDNTVTSNGTWTSAAGVFSGTSENGFLSVAGTPNGVASFNCGPVAGEIIAEVRGDYAPTGIGASFDIGFQVSEPDKGLLANQKNKVLARVKQTGEVVLNVNIGGTTYSATSNITLAGGNATISMRLAVNLNSKEATLTVEGPQNTVTTTVAWPGVTSPQWTALAINRLGGGSLFLDHAKIYKMPGLPETFPINMSFRPLESGDDVPPAPVLTHEQVIEKYLQFCPVNHGTKDVMTELKKQLLENSHSDVIGIGLASSWTVGPVEGGGMWPGYFLYCAATTLSGNITATQTAVSVGDVANIRMGDTVGIFEVNADNSPNWNSFENAYVSAVDTANKVLTLVRASVGGAARSFPQGSRVAAHAYSWKKIKGSGASPSDVSVQWLYNCSLHAPRNSAAPSDEQEGFQMMVKKVMADYDEKNAEGLLDGLEHDTCQAIPSNDTVPIDCDNNGAGDSGFIGGIPSYYLGMQRYTQALRAELGPDGIIQFDCTLRRKGYRGWKYVNGIRIEDFLHGSELNYSGVFEQLSVWAEKAGSAPRISYGYTKDVTETYGGVVGKDSKFRADFAVGLMLGLPHPFGWENDGSNPSYQQRSFYDWDECHGGTLNNWAWLGKPLGAATRDLGNCNLTNDLLSGKTWSVANKTSEYTSTVNGEEIFVTTTKPQGCDVSGVSFKPNSSVPIVAGQTYTLKLTAKGEDSYVTSAGTFDQMPRWVNVADYGDSGNIGMLADSSWRTVYLTFKATTTTSKPTFGVSETAGRTWIKDIALYEGSADRWSREFENGIVFLNGTDAPWTATLPTLASGWKYYRLKNNTPEQAGHNPNDGSEVTAGSVTIPAKDAVYLLKSQTPPPAN